MSGSNLGIHISATDTASATVKQLQSTLAQFEGLLAQVGREATTSGAAISAHAQKSTDNLKAQIAAIKEEIAAYGGQAAGIRGVTAALGEQATAAAVVHRTLQQGIDVTTGVESSRAMKSAAASASVLATSLGAAAEADARFRDIQLSTVGALNETTAATERAAMATRGLGRSRAMSGVGGAAAVRASASGAIAGEELAIGAAIGGAGSILTKESRHIVGLFDSLARGQRGQAFSSIGAAARDAGLGVAGLASSIAGMTVIMGTAALLHGAENLGKWAEGLRATASATGMTVRELSGLQAALVHTGADADSANAALRRFADNTAKGIADPKSDITDAWQKLGVSLEELRTKGSTTSGALHLLADAFVRTNDSENKTDAMTKIAGRSYETLIRIIQDGGPAFDALIEQMGKTGKVVDELGSKSLAQTGEAVRTLGESMSGDFTQAIITAGGSVETFVEILLGLERTLYAIGAIVIAPIVIPYRIVKAAGQAAADTGISMTDGSAEFNPYTLGQTPSTAPTKPIINPDVAYGPQQGVMKADVGPPKVKGAEASVMATMRDQMNEAALAASKTTTNRAQATQREGEAEIAVMQKTLATATLTAAQRTQIHSEMVAKQLSLSNASMSAGATVARQDYSNFAAAEKLKISEAQGSSTKIQAIYSEWLTAAEGRYRQSAAVIANIEREKTQAINAARLSELKTNEEQEDQAARLVKLNTELARFSGGGAAGARDEKTVGPAMDMQRAQQARDEAAQVEATADQRISARQQLMSQAEPGSTQQIELQKEITSITIAAKSQEVQLYQKSADLVAEANKKMAASFVTFFDQMGSHFESFTSSALKALIAPQQELIREGLTTIKKSMQGQELAKAAGSMIMGIAGDLGKAVEGALGHVVAGALSGGASNSVGELLGTWMSKAVSSIAPGLMGAGTSAATGAATTATTTAAIATGAATTGTAIAAGATATVTGITTAIVASTTAIVGAITGSTASEVLATDVGHPSLLGFSMAGGGIIPSAAGGMLAGGMGGSLAILHPKEMVLPANISQAVQNMTTGGLSRDGSSTSTTHSANLNYSPTINTSSRSRGGTGMSRSEFSQMMSTHSGAMMGEARNMIRSGWRPS